MIGLKLIDGDLAITNNKIELVEGNDLTTQTIQSVLSTNKGEWFFDAEEGVEFDNLLGEQHADDLVRAEIEQGIAQVDSAMAITTFARKYNSETRTSTVTFSARTGDGETVEVSTKWG